MRKEQTSHKNEHNTLMCFPLEPVFIRDGEGVPNFIDEATTGLDPVVRDEMLDLFLEFIQDEGCSIFFSSHITSNIQKIADYVILIHQGKIIFEEQKDDLVYHFGIVKCGREKFASISPNDYIIHRITNVSVECLVSDKEAIKRKYKDIVVDNATLEDIMLFYIKGGAA